MEGQPSATSAAPFVSRVHLHVLQAEPPPPLPTSGCAEIRRQIHAHEVAEDPVVRRPARPRASTQSIKRVTKGDLQVGRLVYPERVTGRPLSRGDCKGGPRPCPFVSCRYHLYLEVDERIGSIKLNRPDLEPWNLQESCALDVADRGGHTLEQVGEIINVTRERLRQLEETALDAIAAGYDPLTGPLVEDLVPGHLLTAVLGHEDAPLALASDGRRRKWHRAS